MYLADRPRVALDYLADSLEADPRCYEALVMAGEIYDRWASELGLDEREGSLVAVAYFDRAIAAQPDHAEAYADRAIALLHLEEYQAALRSAEAGLREFDNYPTKGAPPEVWVNIGESLYRAKALSLKEMGRVAEGRRALQEGLSRFSGSEYLTQVVDTFLPEQRRAATPDNAS
jgi:tetratricopeptide (TPR) repeat protein